jgi:hypothetical protein
MYCFCVEKPYMALYVEQMRAMSPNGKSFLGMELGIGQEPHYVILHG